LHFKRTIGGSLASSAGGRRRDRVALEQLALDLDGAMRVVSSMA
jgi:hypothetical protein